MKKMDLQMFAEAVKGNRVIYLYRVLTDEATKSAMAMAFTTENSISKSRDSDTVSTKDGAIRVPGDMETEITATSLLAKGDELYERLEEAMEKNEVVEVWEANLDEPAETGENKFKGAYYQAYLGEFEKTSSAEDHVEISTTFSVIGIGKKGDVTVSAEQQAVAEYVFKDTTSTGA